MASQWYTRWGAEYTGRLDEAKADSARYTYRDTCNRPKVAKVVVA